MLDILTEVRQSQKDKEVMAERFADGLVKVFGDSHRTSDPHFDARYYAMSDLEKGERLIERKNKKGNLWWAPAEESIATEADSGALSRAWPVGVVYADHISSAHYYADYLTTITHRHPTARAAASALVTGIAHAMHGATVDEMVDQMIVAAERFDKMERLEKNKARRVKNFASIDPEIIAKESMLTSDLIRFAAYAAKEGKSPAEILGTNSKKQDSGRSYRGHLLGNQADEAVAAAVYLIVRNPENLKAIVAEGSFAGGNSALITSLAGAFFGARHGLSGINKQGFSADVDALENKAVLLELAAKVDESIRYPGKLHDNKGDEKDFQEHLEKYHHNKNGSIFTLKNLAILGACIARCYTL